MEKSVDPKLALKVGIWLLAISFAVILFIAVIVTALDREIDSALAVSGGLIVVIIALGGLAAIIGGLGLSGHAEAFALPGGTVRSVLALGILIVLIFFALNQFKTTFRPPEARQIAAASLVQLAGESEGDFASRRRATLNGWQQAGLIVVQTGPSAFALFHKADNTQAVEFAKQLLVMLGTLLTSIVSFYFGSRVAEGARTGGSAASAGIADAAGAKTRLAELKARRGGVQARIDELNTLLAEAKARLDAMEEAVRPAAKAVIDAAATTIGGLAAPAAAADAAINTFEGLIPAEGASADWSAVTTAANAAAGKLDDLDKAVAAAGAEREKLVSIARAEG